MPRITGMESLVWRWRCTSLPHGAWAGLASPAVRGEEDRELTFEVGDDATGSGMVTGLGTSPAASRPKAGLAMATTTEAPREAASMA
jgi:hypothetical protein